MENKRGAKKNAKVSGESSKQGVKPSREEISYALFFAAKVREGKLKAWQHDEVLSFFKDHGLREKEEPKVYEDLLGKF